MEHADAQELARARLAYVSAGRPALGAPRRAAPNPDSTAPDPTPSEAPLAATAETLRTPEPSPGPVLLGRVLTAKHLLVVAVLVLCGVGVAVAALGRSAATEVPVQPIVSQSVPAVTSSPAVRLRVHVIGAVAQPGVVSVEEGAIVEDAIAAAGGLIPEADPAELNLAAPVAAGMQIVIGTVDEPVGEVKGTAANGVDAASGLVDLNRATQSELEALPGVGPVTAQAIIGLRDEQGQFTTVEELMEVTGIGPKTFEKLRSLVTV